MYAVVNIKGFQYMLEKGDTLRVPKFDVEVGKKIKLSEVLLVADGKKNHIGQPFIDGAVVEATVVSHDKYDKIVVFKKRRRKDSSVKMGHRQDFTEISIDTIKIKTKQVKKETEKKPETSQKVTETPVKTKDAKKAAPKAKTPAKATPKAEKAPKAKKPIQAKKAEKKPTAAKKVAKKPVVSETVEASAKPEKMEDKPETPETEK